MFSPQNKTRFFKLKSMKKYLFLLIFGLSLSQLYAQKEKHFFVRINGSYWQCNKETPNAGSNEYGDFHLASNPTYINTSVSFGKKISAELSAGFGLHYRSVNNKIEDKATAIQERLEQSAKEAEAYTEGMRE